MSYEHSSDPILSNLHNTIQYDGAENPAIRVSNSPGSSLETSFADNFQLTSFNRLRTSATRLLGEYRYMYASGTSNEMNDKLTGTSSISVDYNLPAANLLINGTNSSAIRQTRQYHPYTGGSNNLGYFSFKCNPQLAGLTQRIGLFDNTNGLFFEINDSTISFVIRSSSVDSKTSIENWNLKIPALDFTKCQLLVIDYQWLGVGRVRFGFVVDGVLTYCHQVTHTNSLTAPYMAQPSLPCRWEISSTTVVSGTLMAICAAVYAESSSQETGFQRSVACPLPITVSNTTDGICVLAVRLKNQLVNGKLNQAMAKLQQWSVTSDNLARYKLVVFNDNTAFLNTPTWTAIPGFSWCESASNLVMTSGWASNINYCQIVDNYVTGATGHSSGQIQTLIDNRTASIFQNFDSTGSQVFAIIAFKVTSSASMTASLVWNEIK